MNRLMTALQSLFMVDDIQSYSVCSVGVYSICRFYHKGKDGPENFFKTIASFIVNSIAEVTKLKQD